MKWTNPSNDRYAFAIFGIVLLVEFLFFRRFAEREIIWAYPNHHDQLDFLFNTYDLYTGLLNREFGPWKECLYTPSPRGFLFPIYGVVLCLLFGATRLACLSVNFILFGALQGCLLYTVRWLTGSIRFGFVAVGLVLSQASAFFYAGGMFDYRTDFSAYCLYGIWILVVLRSGVFADTKWTIVAALVAAWLMVTRYITVPYIVGATLLTFLGIVLKYRATLSDAKEENEGWRRIKRASLFLVITSVLTSPFLYLATSAMWKYYGSHHFIGPEKYVRAAEQHISDLPGHLTYYPASIWYDHLGPCFVILSAALLCVACALRWRRRYHPTFEKEDTGRPIPAMLFIISAIVSPLIILTVIITKSQVVGGIVGVPAALAVFTAIAHIVGKTLPASPGTFLSSRTCAIFAVISMVFGLGNYLYHLAGRGPFHDRRVEIADLMRIYDSIGRYAETAGRSPKGFFFVNMVSDAMNSMVVSVVYFEKRGILIRMKPGLGHDIFAVDRETIFKQLEETDILVLGDTSERFPLNKHYPLNQTLTPLTGEMQRWAEHELVPLLSTPSRAGRGYAVYVRAAMGVTGLTADRLVTADGVWLTGDSRVIARRPRCVVAGTLDAPSRAVPAMRAALYPQIGLPASVPVDVERDGLSLRITLDFSKALLPDHGEVSVFLQPVREAGSEQDRTRAVFRWETVRMERAPDKKP